MKSKIIPLIKEPHPENYSGCPFLTLIEFKNVPLITIVDNYYQDVISAYVLDHCDPEGIDQSLILQAAEDWFINSRTQYPLSFHFSKNDMTEVTSKIYRTYQAEYVTRAIGPVPSFAMDEVISIRRRRRRDVSTVPVVYK